MIFFVLQTQLDAMPELIAHSLTQIRPPETRASLEGGSAGGSIGRLAGGRGGGGGGGGGVSRLNERRRYQRTLEESEGTEIFRHDEVDEEYYEELLLMQASLHRFQIDGDLQCKI